VSIRRSGLGCRETSGPPIVSYGALVSVGRPRWATSEASRERARCGCTQFVWVAEVGSTHRASSSPVGRKAGRWSKRALAGRKSAAPPDVRARMGRRRNGAEVSSGSEQGSRGASFMGFGSWARNTTEGVLGLLPVLLSTGKAARGPLTSRSTPPQPPAVFGKLGITALTIGQHIGRTGIRLGCACG